MKDLIIMVKIKYVLFTIVIVSILVASYISWRSTVTTSIRCGEHINVLITGTDWVDYSRHADTIIFLSYNPKTRFLDIVSIPRDTKIDLPDIKLHKINQLYTYHYRKTKNHYYALNALTKVVSVLFNNRISIPYFFQVDYALFCKAIDAVGGIEIEVEEPMHYDDSAGNLHIHFEPGRYLFNGQKALEYIRYRGNAGDTGRIYRQQRFLRALIEKVKNPFFIFKLRKLAKMTANKLHTNLSLWDMANLLLEIRHIKLNKIRMALLPGKPYGSVWIVNQFELNHAMDLIVGPEMQPGEAGEGKFPTVEVLNASPHNGAALEVTRKLRDMGFDVIDYRNYSSRQKKTIVIDRVGNLTAAQKIARLLDTQEIFTRYDSRRITGISVIIGEDYKK
jgi:LCP family protein required for cell wall assembly